MTDPTNQPILSKDQMRQLRQQAHHLKPELYIGKDGLTQSFIDSIYTAFNTKELLKVKLLNNSPVSRASATVHLSHLDKIAMIQNIGHTFVLYKELEDEA